MNPSGHCQQSALIFKYIPGHIKKACDESKVYKREFLAGCRVWLAG
jgi:hypothetical protein